MRTLWLLGISAALTGFVACGDDDDDDDDSGEGEGEDDATCAEVCEVIDGCPGVPAGDQCEAGCASFSTTCRNCLAAAVDCATANSCASCTGGGDGDADTDADTDTDSDSDADVDCASGGEACGTSMPCEVWVCTCMDDTTGREPGACIDGVCDQAGLGVGSTCDLFCQRETGGGAANARTDFGACE